MMYVTVDRIESCDEGEYLVVTVGMGKQTYELRVQDGTFGTFAELQDKDSGNQVGLGNRP